jgi:hypothetical protein
MSAVGASSILAGIDGERTARRPLPWIPLMTGGTEEAIISEWKRSALRDPDSRCRAQYGGLALLFAQLAKHGSPAQSDPGELSRWLREAPTAVSLDRFRAVLGF